eukprot:NODE_3671_length_2001_cov_18.928495.p1 GENE.NODE_3671_length_2001_cov_18.928495~~NODE_3671_length_2001_cov_18.928495.p1  ORF type:complete len:437 (+),score=107.97 NODE_3671_length_2001_cov_18.928495:495-1805(+)
MASYGFESGSDALRFLTGSGSFTGKFTDVVWFFIIYAFEVHCMHWTQRLHEIMARTPAVASYGAHGAKFWGDDAPHLCGAPRQLAALAARWRTTPAQILVLAAFLTLVLAPAMAGWLILDGQWWDGLRYKMPQVANFAGAAVAPSYEEQLARGEFPDEYEACEFVRYRAFVRAPINAWSSFAFLYGASYNVLHGNLLWRPLLAALSGSRGGGTLIEVFRTVQNMANITICVILCWASFVYHASITDEMNYLDVRAMYLGLGAGVLQELDVIWERMAPLPRPQKSGLLRLLAALRMPAYLISMSIYSITALFTDFLSHRFSTLIPILFLANVVLGLARARAHDRQAATAVGRDAARCRLMAQQRRWGAALIVAGILCKAVDDTKVFCFSLLRSTPLQLTGLFHVFLGIGFGLAIISHTDWCKHTIATEFAVEVEPRR